MSYEGRSSSGCRGAQLARRALVRATSIGLLLVSGTVAAETLHTGVWWDPAESGWGMMVTDQGSVLAPYWYAPDDDGEPTWFVAPAMRQADGSYRGTILRHTGVPLAQIAGQAADPEQAIGEATLRFADGVLSLSYTLDGVSGSKQLQRFNFNGKDVDCQAATAGAQAASTNYSDLWYQPAASGWGLQVTHLDDALFLTWYTYDQDREAVYFNGLAERTGTARFSGTLYRTDDGTPFLEVDGAPASGGASEVGTFTLDFSNGTNGTFSYVIGGVSQSKPVQRIQFGSAVAVCSAKAWQAPGSSGGGGGGNASGEECLPPYRVGDDRRVRITSTSGATTETLTRDERIVGQDAFEGASALVEEVSGSTSAGTGVYARNYYAADGGNEVAVFGSRSFDPATGQLLATSVNQPLRIAQPRFFASGQTWEEAWTVRASAQGTTAVLDVTSRWRFLGRETVTTPAGTFNACKFETHNEVSGTTAGVSTIATDNGTSWTHQAWGLVRAESTGSSVVQSPFGSVTTATSSRMELLSASRNGQSTP